MLKTQVMTEEDYKNYLRPAILDSINSVLRIYGLETTAEIYYDGADEIGKLIGANNSDTRRANTYTDMIYRNKIYITPTIEDSPINVNYGNSRRMMTERPIFFMENEEVGLINIYPGFEGIKVVVAVNAQFNSRKLAEQFIRRINLLTDKQVGMQTFDATTHMIVNPGISKLLENIYNLLKKNNPNTPDLQEWFDKGANANFTTISNAIGNNLRLAVPFKFRDIRLEIDGAHLQRAARGNVTGRWEAELIYSFYFNNFTHWELEYPLNIYQDEIDAEFIPTPQDNFREQYVSRCNTELGLISALVADRVYKAPYYFKLPEHDPYGHNKIPFTYPFYQVRLSVQDVPRQVIVPDIFNLPYLKWNPVVECYIRRIKDRTFKHNFSPFLLLIMSNDIRIEPEQLTLDEDSNIVLNRKPTMFNTHRFIINLDMSIRDWDESFWDDLDENPQDQDVVPPIFPWYDWGKWEDKGGWFNNKDKVIEEIDIGFAKAITGMNIYQMELGLFTYKFN